MRITYLESVDFPPFQDLKLDFSATKSKGKLAEVHLLTGINGTGKTRILCLLAAFLGNPNAIRSRFGDGRSSIQVNLAAEPSNGDSDDCVGMTCEMDELFFQFDRRYFQCPELFPDIESITGLAYGGAAYVAESTISIAASVKLPSKEQLLSFEKTFEHNQVLFQQLANIKLQGALDNQNGSSVRSKWNAVLKAIQASVSEVTGYDFSFHVQVQPEPKLSVNWRKIGSPLSVNLLPDGLRALIGWMVDAATMLSLSNPKSDNPLSEPAIILLDEPETHLHPAWQRMVLPVAQRLFPNAQIFVATHSPFIVSSVNEGWIHKLVLRDDGTVYALEPKAAVPGDSFIDATEDDLGLGPKQWYDPESEKLMTEFREARESALAGDAAALAKARELGESIGARGEQLSNLVAAELAQLDRILTQRKSA
jgi:AAA domain, putative AbiEii toxin, Type IV TA system